MAMQAWTTVSTAEPDDGAHQISGAVGAIEKVGTHGWVTT